MSVRALIVDDDPRARERLRRLLSGHVDIVVVGEAADAADAVTKTAQVRPEVLFLDISMPRVTGLDLRSVPAVIFTTADTRYAAAAFDLNAIDYLLKPVGEERLERALNRLRCVLNPMQNVSAPHVPQWTRRVVVQKRGETLVVAVGDIRWIAAEGNYCRIYTSESSYLLREALSSVNKRLDPTIFLRVHRSTIVNVDSILKLSGNGYDGHSIVLADGTSVRVGSTYFSAVARRLLAGA